jgi:hypothetical protein
MLEGEIIFYNGFNLLVDIIVAIVAGFIFYRMGDNKGFEEGVDEGVNIALTAVEEGTLVQELCPETGKLEWTFKQEEEAPRLFVVPEAE